MVKPIQRFPQFILLLQVPAGVQGVARAAERPRGVGASHPSSTARASAVSCGQGLSPPAPFPSTPGVETIRSDSTFAASLVWHAEGLAVREPGFWEGHEGAWNCRAWAPGRKQELSE